MNVKLIHENEFACMRIRDPFPSALAFHWPIKYMRLVIRLPQHRERERVD